ncbi:hypothetical protein [Wenyingzhuangia sp. 2_MG-2023]|nr:hypothetical protein [Wenyingzhuangia sp. 2_MG-2023]MDO6737133.1 hypothetical protein [Wenyingzhuangia sp. 2_MG-2023]
MKTFVFYNINNAFIKISIDATSIAYAKHLLKGAVKDINHYKHIN